MGCVVCEASRVLVIIGCGCVDCGSSRVPLPLGSALYYPWRAIFTVASCAALAWYAVCRASCTLAFEATVAIFPDLFDQYKNHDLECLAVGSAQAASLTCDLCACAGFTFSNAIQCGVLKPHLGVGATAGDEECFELFKVCAHA